MYEKINKNEKYRNTPRYMPNICYNKTDILLFGREDTGLPDYVTKKCEILAGIPMPGGDKNCKTGGVRSLNLSVACGIVSYNACLQLNLLS